MIRPSARRRAVVLLAVIALGFASACSAGPAGTTEPASSSVAPESTVESVEPAPAQEVEPRNPVDVIRQLGDPTCKTKAEAGEEDINGNWYASCSWYDNSGTPGTEFTVRTYPGDPTEFDPNVPFRSTDSNRVIIGVDFAATITGDWTSYSKRFTSKTLVAMAEKLGGDYLPPGARRG